MKTKPRIAFVADLTADVYVDSHTVKYGGAALNMAMWAKRVGVNSEIVSAVGNDAEGKGFLSYIRKQGLATIGIQKKRGSTSSIEIFLKNGERNYGQWRPGVLTTFHVRKKDATLLCASDAIVVTIYPQYEHILNELPQTRPLVVINFGDLKEFHDNLDVVLQHADIADILLFFQGCFKRFLVFLDETCKFRFPVCLCFYVLVVGNYDRLRSGFSNKHPWFLGAYDFIDEPAQVLPGLGDINDLKHSTYTVHHSVHIVKRR